MRASGTVSRRWAAASAVVMVPLLAASAAWACSPSAYVSVNPTSGVAGDKVQVSGKQFYGGLGYSPVEIRWNSTTGDVRGVATGPSFSVGITIPDAAPGVYAIVALQRDHTGQVVGTKSAAFTVKSAAGTPDPGTAPPESRQDGSTSAETSAGDSGDNSPRSQSNPGAQPASSGNASGSPSRPAATAGPAATPKASGGAARQRSNSSALAGPGAQAGESVSPAAADGPGQADATGPVAVVDEEAPALSPRMSAEDLWSGFATGSGPSAASLADVPAPTSGSGANSLGLGLLGLGLFAMAGLATIARRRVRVNGEG